MKYVSIDIETTGLDPETCQIIEFAAVIEDTSNPFIPVDDLPSFRRLVTHDLYQGEPYALAMHADKFYKLSDKNKHRGEIIRSVFLAPAFACFLHQELGSSDTHTPVKVSAAGKNFAAFDLQFLKRLPEWNSCIKVSSRILDPGNLFFDPEFDEDLPDLLTCKKRAGWETEVKHEALEDARDVIRVIRKYYERKEVPA